MTGLEIQSHYDHVIMLAFSVGLTIDKSNRDYFEKIEKRITKLFDSDELHLIKTTHDYSKVYGKLYAINGEIITPIKILSNGKKKKLDKPNSYVGIPFQGQVVLRISKVYEGGTCLSLVCEAKEVLIEEIQNPPSYFDEFSDVEDSDE